MNWPPLDTWARELLEIGKEFAGSGPLHRRRLEDIDIRIAVSGVRGKSTAVRWLHDILHDRGYDTYAKVTGTEPVSIHNGTVHPIDRPAKVRLYENERQLQRFAPVDAAVVENQGIRSYTTRLVNEQFVRPDVIFLTNIREDHLDTLGPNRVAIARSLARAVPAGTHVICGEQDGRLREYLAAELDRRDATYRFVDVPAAHRTLPGAELIDGLDAVLQQVGEDPLSAVAREAYRDRLRVSWTQLPDGRVYNAAAVNDTQSLELVRRQLATAAADQIQPLVYLRGDRRGRTAAVYRYLEALAARDVIEQARAVGEGAQLVARRASFPVLTHDAADEAPAAVLDAALADGWPVLVMGNTISPFMDGLSEAIEARCEVPAADSHNAG
jgi:hypothetical protein